MTITVDMQDAILKVPVGSRTSAYDGDGQVRDGAWVADITGMLDLSSWPSEMRIIVRKERPHPGRSCGSLTSTGTGSPTPGKATDPELRHRRRARCEDRIRNAKDTGLRNLPLKGFAQNQLWCEITAPASQLRRVRASMAHEAALTAGYCRGRQTRSAPTSASSLTPIRPLGCKELPLASGDALSFCGIANVRQHVENHKINACLKITWISGQS